MEQEYKVLTHLQENKIITQRKISKSTGLSLGAVKLLLKKMVRKGLVKVEKLNARTMRYNLTPQGLQEKTRLTCPYICQSHKQILKLNRVLDQLLDTFAEQLDGKALILFGPADEILEILTWQLGQKGVLFEVYGRGVNA